MFQAHKYKNAGIQDEMATPLSVIQPEILFFRQTTNHQLVI
jgi:hypothetical protein